MSALLRLAVTVASWAPQSPEELCGLLYGEEVIAIVNVSPNPTREYAMDPETQMAVMVERGWPDAVWHTHPGGTREPSTLDLASALPGVPYVIGAAGWGGVYVDGEQTAEVAVSGMTNDIGEVFQGTDKKWRWRRRAGGNHAIIGVSGESFDSKRNAADALIRANPDLAPDEEAQGLGEAVPDVVDGGTPGGGAASAGGSTGGPATGAPGTGSGGNAYGVGPTTAG